MLHSQTQTHTHTPTHSYASCNNMSFGCSLSIIMLEQIHNTISESLQSLNEHYNFHCNLILSHNIYIMFILVSRSILTKWIHNSSLFLYTIYTKYVAFVLLATCCVCTVHVGIGESRIDICLCWLIVSYTSTLLSVCWHRSVRKIICDHYELIYWSTFRFVPIISLKLCIELW